MSWQSDLADATDARAEREAARPPLWVVTATDPPTFGRVWCLRYTRAMLDAGVRVAEDLDMLATVHERGISASFEECGDGMHAMLDIDPPICAVAVRADRMNGVVSALRRSGYHAHCSDGHGKEYEF